MTIDAAKPACDETYGVCVPCTAQDASGCAEMTPICEGNECRACQEHAECESHACDIAAGACFPAATALWVDVNGACDDAGPGTEDMPLCSLGQAVARALEGIPQAILVRGGVYGGTPVPIFRIVAIVRVGEEAVEITGSLQGALLDIDGGGGARVYLDGLNIRDNAQSIGVSCGGADLWVDRTLIRGHQSGILTSTGCQMRMRGSVVTGNHAVGVYLNWHPNVIENSFITDNGDKILEPDNYRGGIHLNQDAQVELSYTTLVGNDAPMNLGASITCWGPASILSMRNSIAFNKSSYNTFSGNCDLSVVSLSAISQVTDDPDDANLGIHGDMISSLVTADGGIPGVYRPFVDTELANVALFGRGDPEFDFEGDPRPTEGPSYPGADEP